MVVTIVSQGKGLDRDARLRMKTGLMEALQRFSNRLRSLRIAFRDVNGPRGGVDKECTICVSLARSSAIVIKSRAETFRKAFSDAVERLKVALSRESKRRYRRSRRKARRTAESFSQEHLLREVDIQTSNGAVLY